MRPYIIDGDSSFSLDQFHPALQTIIKELQIKPSSASVPHGFLAFDMTGGRVLRLWVNVVEFKEHLIITVTGGVNSSNIVGNYILGTSSPLKHLKDFELDNAKELLSPYCNNSFNKFMLL